MSGQDIDVLVVGYGPVGALVSLLMGRAGHRVLAVDRFDEPYRMPRAVHYDDEVARILQGAGLADALAPIVEPLGSYQWRNAAGETLLRFDWPGGEGTSGWPASSMFSQPALEAVLDAAVARLDSVTVRRGCRVVDVDPDGVVSFEDGARIRARWVVAADGAQSEVRSSLDVPVTDLGFSYDWLVVDVVENDPRVWEPPAWQLCDPARPTTLVPGGPGRRRFEFMRLPDESAEELTATVWDLLAPWGLDASTCRLERHAMYTFRAMWAQEWRRGRVLLAGDAAHLMPPFAGQGLCAGVRDAANFAWKLDLVLRERAGDALLDTYTSERVGQVEVSTSLSVELGKIVCVTDPAAARDRDRQFLDNRTDTGPVAPPPLPIGPGLRRGSDANAGLLFPQGRVRAAVRGAEDDAPLGPEQRLGDVLGTRCWLLGVGTPPSVSPASAAALQAIDAVTATFGVDMVDAGDTYEQWFATSGCSVALVRPDGYVFGTVCSVEDTDELVADLVGQLDADGAVGD